MHWGKLFAALSVLAISACETPDLYPSAYVPPPNPARRAVAMSTPFNEHDFAWSAAPGKAVITGQGFIKSGDGGVKTCAGNEVVLIPHNTYTIEIRTIGVMGGQAIRDPRYMPYRKTTMCDVGGNFRFENLPAGTWRVVAIVKFLATGPYGAQWIGGDLDKVVTTQATGSQQVLLTFENLVK